ncbi:MAG: restriction endonuclease subunit S [Deltaproteobacteria bacterium]|nr:restriction endonuclease subunit S [Deltaproteobacteria bacterium]
MSNQISTLRMEQKFKKTPAGEIPVDWEAKQLGKVGIATDGDWILNKDYSKSGVRLLQIADIGVGKFLNKSMRFISEESANKLNCSILQPGDILISRMPDPIGRACQLPELNYQSITAVDVTIWRPDPDKYDRRFLTYYLNSSKWFALVNNYSSGTTRTRISRTNLENIEIPIPPLKEQRLIAKILSAVDDAIDKTDAVIEKTKELKKGLMQILFTKGIQKGRLKTQDFKETEIGRIPKDWEIRNIKSLAKKIINGGTPDTNTEKYWHGNIPWITGADFSDQKVTNIRRHITKEAVANSNTNVVPQGTILVVTRTGVGKLAMASYDIAISQDITGIISNDELVIPRFLFWILNYYVPQLKAAHQGTSINGILRSDLEDFMIPVPTIQEQKKITEILSTIDDEISHEEKHKHQLEQIKTALMQVLLTGKVRV